jgi:hypothetical protein
MDNFPKNVECSFVHGASIPIKCGIAVEWGSNTYVLVHVEGDRAYLLSIWGEDQGKKYSVPLHEVMQSASDVCFVL